MGIALAAPTLLLLVLQDAARRWLPGSWPDAIALAAPFAVYMLIGALPMLLLGAAHARQRRRQRLREWFVPSLVNVPPDFEEDEQAPEGRRRVVALYVAGFGRIYWNPVIRWRLFRKYGIHEIQRGLIVLTQALWIGWWVLGVAALRQGSDEVLRAQLNNVGHETLPQLLDPQTLSWAGAGFLAVTLTLLALGTWCILDIYSEEHRGIAVSVYGYGQVWNPFARTVVVAAVLCLAFAFSDGAPTDLSARTITVLLLLSAAAAGGSGTLRHPMQRPGDPPPWLMKELEKLPKTHRPVARASNPPDRARDNAPPRTKRLRSTVTRHYSSGTAPNPDTRAPWPVEPAVIHPLGPRDHRQLGPYSLEGWVGRGGFGVVYVGRAKHGITDLVAVKSPHPHLVGDDGELQRFVQEGQMLARVAGKRIARVLDAGITDGMPYLATEYLPGETLHAHRRRRPGTFAHAPAIELLALQLAEALATCHEATVVHRDVTPSNVVLTSHGAYLIDLGAGLVGDVSTRNLTPTGTVLGATGFMAPEVLLGQRPTPAADVWAWACTIVAAVHGSSPYLRSNREATWLATLHHDRNPAALDAVRGVSPGLHRSVLDCLEYRPEHRPETGAALHATLEKVLETSRIASQT